jgi:hypothetical protein
MSPSRNVPKECRCHTSRMAGERGLRLRVGARYVYMDGLGRSYMSNPTVALSADEVRDLLDGIAVQAVFES